MTGIGRPLLLASAASILGVMPAHAATTSPSSDALQSNTSASDTAASLEEVVVTARRRNELLQDVPIAVSAITQETAERNGITGVEAITLATPNFQMNREISQGATPYLRGVGSPQASAGGESPVAVYLDDVYIGSPNGNMFAFNNIAGVQVLKGPQGTLFGRNATGGVIQVQTRAPSADPAFEATAGYGNYDHREGSLYATTGLGDGLAFNIAASGRDQKEGFGRSLTTGAETQKGWDWNVRAQMLWEPSDSAKVRLIADYGKQESDFGSNNSSYPGSVSLGGAPYLGRDTLTAGTDYALIKQGGVSARIDYETSFADLVSISAYRYTRLEFTYDQDLGPPPLVQVGTVRSPTKSLSQEFQVVSKPDSPISWIGGLFYLRTKTGYDPSRIGGIFFAPLNTVSLYDMQTLNSYSAFGESTFEVFADTNLTVGVRYTRDEYDLDVEGRIGNDSFPLPGNTFQLNDTFSKLTYRAILDHDFTPDVMGYASYSRGFRSGGYSLAFPGNAAAPAEAVKPEVLDAFEVGLKTKLLNGRMTLNGAAFYYDYSDLAINFVQPGGNLVLNAAKARIMGLDVDFNARLGGGFNITGGLGILDSEYTKFPDGPVLLPNPATCTPTPTILPGPRTGGNLPCTTNLTGNTAIRAPKFTLTLGPNYRFSTSAGSITVAANIYHNSGFFWDVGNRLRQPSYTVVNSSVTWEAPSETFNVRLWVNNVTDEDYGAYVSPAILGDPYAAAAPRTYGVTVGLKF